ncbi:TIGR01212 family radical SAM protein [Candidatus Aerophobetes bacterium Ae_b3a]|nr:MAG: TIGR01212 family radical SAM protein [Candidatus Aerophobetes bacterium Ae_b3a]
MKHNGRRYYPFSQFLKERFGCKVYKLPVDAGFTCPNRDGKIGYGGCTYCYNPSFSPPILLQKSSISLQVKYRKALLKRKGKVNKFLVYFQSYTNTYAKVKILKRLYDEAIQDKDVIGFCIGTRPDCVPDEVLDLIESYAQNYHIWLEYGLQSMHDETLLRIRRGHNFAQFGDAVKRTQGRNIFICVHIILGLPGEAKEDILKTTRALVRMGIDGIKLHHLQVIKNTRIAREFSKGEFKVLSLEDYIKLVCDVLELLPARIAIQRLVGEVLQDKMLVAPRWNLNKHKVLSAIDQEFVDRGSFQGSKFDEADGSERKC